MTTLSDLVWPVRTERLLLRPGTPDDAAAIFAFRSRPEVAQWLSSQPASVADLGPERFDWSMQLVVEREGAVIGDLMVQVQDAWAQAEIREAARRTQAELGWSFDPDEWGHGYATEAIRAAMGIAFDGLGVRRIEASCFADNTASWRIMEKLGMRREGYFVVESLHRDGTWCDGMTYALLADEWRATAR